MKLYHGSPKRLELLKPQKATGMDDFQNQTAVFLTDDFTYAALYAIGKHLKNMTAFGVSAKISNKVKNYTLKIMGNHKLSDGYVYEVETDDFTKSGMQYACPHELIPLKEHIISVKNYEQYILRVGPMSKEEFNKLEKMF